MFKYIEHDVVYNCNSGKCYTVINKDCLHCINWYTVRNNSTYEITTMAEHELTLDKRLTQKGVVMNKFNINQEVICHFGTKEVEGTIKECTYYDEYDSYVYLVYIPIYHQTIGFLEHHIKEKNSGN